MNFSKNQKKKKFFFGMNLGPFCSNLVKNEFFVERRVLNIPIIYHHVKNQKKLISLRKMLDLMDGQADTSDFIGPSTI